MTRYFEVTRHDGAARTGKLLLKESHSTPMILEVASGYPIVYAGSPWGHNTLAPGDVEDGTLVILPDKSMPLHAGGERVKRMVGSARESMQVWDGWQGAVGRIIHPAYPDISPADLYVLGAAKQMEHNPRVLMESIIYIRNHTPPDTALYAPAMATPENVGLLVYIGVDVVDDTLAVVKGFNDIYMMPGGEYRLKDLVELPCRCNVCSNTSIAELIDMDAAQRGELVARHNKTRLEEEKRIIVQHIRDGHLREYVEGKCRSDPWLTALLRLTDQEYSYLEQRTHTYHRSTMYTNSAESLNRVEVKRFARRVQERFQSPDNNILLLLPCSARKPYSISNSHQYFSRALGKYRRAINEVIITSPLGIVPRELELVYPAAHYDTPVTGHWDLEERSWVGGCLLDYLGKNRYSHMIAHVDGAYRDICESIAHELGIDILYTANGEGSITSNQSLKKLGETVRDIVNEEGYSLRKQQDITANMLRSIADYQFGTGAGKLLVPDNATIKAPFPKHQVFDGRTQLATLNPSTGALIPTLEGGRRLVELGTYQVHIDDFVPGGTLLAPGVVDADPEIRPSDQVLVMGNRAIGVGRALMGGDEMVRSSRGVAVDLRQVKEI
ncbi:MAG: archaeosine synthase subunit alpha [ANME-2 cluster archaeon]|nr:archaeosine synthase subunit alpha [ANME-2 cluster archaeon]MDF1532588.1 archaeosine synthase subunit alpha [ANME-2 cluster archaeon]